MRRLLCALGTAALLTTGAVDVAAQGAGDVAAARAIGKEGVEAWQAKRFDEAVDKLQRAYSVVKVPTLGLYLGHALRDSGRWVAASETYQEVTQLELDTGNKKVQEKAQQDARKARDELAPRIPKLLIEVSGADSTDVTVTIDDKEVPSALLGVARPVDPGKRIVKVTAANGGTGSAEVTAVEGKTHTVRLQVAGGSQPAPTPVPTPEGAAPVQPEPAKPAPAQPRDEPPDDGGPGAVAWMAYGIGGAGLVAGAVFGFIALGQKSDLDDNCPGSRCSREFHDDVDSYDQSRTFSTVGFIVGAVGIGTGLALSLGGGSDDAGGSDTTAELRLAPGRVSFGGTF